MSNSKEMNPPPPVPPKFKFSEGEKVLCFHGPLLYEAKCIRAQLKDKQVKYFIHYSGWNKNWDEWVPESRVLKYNDANLQKQKELQKAHVKTKKKNTKVPAKKETVAEKEKTAAPAQEKSTKQKASTASTAAATAAGPPDMEAQRKKRTRSEQCIETEEEYIQKIEVKVRIPDELKIWLVDDWDLVTRQKKIIRLPARMTVEHIVAEYLKHKLNEKGMNSNKCVSLKETGVAEVVNGLREYFNVMLGKQLLYKFERPQYQEMLSENPDKSMSEIYGGIHLLRLFARIGAILAYTPLDDDAITLLINNFQDFVKFMSKPSQNFLSLSDYEVASPEYHRKAV